MPQRFANLFIAVAGVITVLGLALVGLDARRSAGMGPRWKRRLVTAGLMLLAVLGWGMGAKDRGAAKAETAEPIVTAMLTRTCYVVVEMPAARVSVERLRKQVPILEKLLNKKKLDPAVVAKTLEAVEKDLAFLGNEAELKRLDEEERKEAVELRDSVRTLADKVRRKMDPREKELTDTEEWKTITKAWAAATPLAESGKSTEAQRKAVDEQLAKAVEAAEVLVLKNALTEAEAGLLESEVARLTSDIRRNPPTDCQVTCYDMAYLPPAQASLKRLNTRLPLLEKLAERGTVHNSVLGKILPSLEADLATLSSEKELASLTIEERSKAMKLRDAAKAHLAAIRKGLGDEK